MLMRFDPFRELDHLAEHFRDGGRMRPMLLDAYRTGDIFHVDFDLPGIEPESIDVAVDKNILSVTAERHWDTEGVDVLVQSARRQLYTTAIAERLPRHRERLGLVRERRAPPGGPGDRKGQGEARRN